MCRLFFFSLRKFLGGIEHDARIDCCGDCVGCVARSPVLDGARARALTQKALFFDAARLSLGRRSTNAAPMGTASV